MSKRWRIAVVVQRYGHEVNGGAELHARWLAEQLTDIGEVHVFTTCAVDYYTWANHYPTGETQIAGVNVSRFPVDKPRDWPSSKRRTFQLLQSDHSLEDEIEWMRDQGPVSTPLLKALGEFERDFDVFIFFTYLYATTFFGLPLVSHKAILVPTAHDEPFIRLNIFKETFNLPKAIVFNTESERSLVNQIFKSEDQVQVVVGVGVNVPINFSADRFRQSYGIEGDFLLYVGRVDESKNVPQLLDFYSRFADQHDDPPALVLIGKSTLPLPDNPRIISLGFVSEEVKFDALSAASVVVIPSLYESLSMIALEAWSMDVPVLVNGRCDVLKQQCRLSNGGLYYYNYLEFASGLERLLGNATLRAALGQQGHLFVDRNYQWDIIRAKYQALFKSLF
jgi:glycosyltransferase involved in cell wall biosynthesis